MLWVKNLFYSVILGAWLTLMLVACSSNDKRSDTPDGAYAIAEEFDKEERYEEAAKRYNEVKNKFPYSRFATLAELAVSDVYFKQESFAEAQVSYQSFKDLHPKHARIDYVTYRLGLSYYMQLPPTIDRDLTLAKSAILFFDEVLSRFPQSEYAKEAREKRDSAVKMLAEKEQYIADFYFKREKYDSALSRYEFLLKNYPNIGFELNALSKAALSCARLGDMDKARSYLKELSRQYSGSKEEASVLKEIR
jgi:outer membrane protein assembly factor BamD